MHHHETIIIALLNPFCFIINIRNGDSAEEGRIEKWKAPEANYRGEISLAFIYSGDNRTNPPTGRFSIYQNGDLMVNNINKLISVNSRYSRWHYTIGGAWMSIYDGYTNFCPMNVKNFKFFNGFSISPPEADKFCIEPEGILLGNKLKVWLVERIS